MSPAAAHEALLARALALSREMLAACEDSRWEDLPALDERRRVVLETLFAPGAAPAAGAAALADAARALLDLDREILARCEAEKATRAREMQHLKDARQAAKAYEGQGRRVGAV